MKITIRVEAPIPYTNDNRVEERHIDFDEFHQAEGDFAGDIVRDLIARVNRVIDADLKNSKEKGDSWKQLMLDADSLLSLIGCRGMIADSEQKYDLERRCIALSGKLRRTYENKT